jgi:hypothetical protein
MTAEEHNKTLGTLYFVYSAIHGLTLIGLLLLVLVVNLTTPAAELISSFWLFVGGLVFVILFVVVGLLPLIVGYGFRKRASWLKPVAFVTAIFSFVNIPIGTALGIYTLKFFRSEAGVKLYGGPAASTAEGALKNALHGAQPLMKLADRLK